MQRNYKRTLLVGAVPKLLFITVLLAVAGCSSKQSYSIQDSSEAAGKENLSTRNFQNQNTAINNTKVRQSVIETNHNVDIANDQPAGSLSNEKDIRLKREASFGSSEEKLVGDIAYFTVDGKNRVFIADGQQISVLVFNADGDYIGSLGREGRGPGEFSFFTNNSKMVIHENQLYVTDLLTISQLNRIQVFNLKDFSFNRTIKLKPQNLQDIEEIEAEVPHNFYPLNNGNLLVAYRMTSSFQKDKEGRVYYLIQDEKGNILSEEAIIVQSAPRYLTQAVQGRSYYLAIETFPFFSKSLLEVSGDDQLYAINSTAAFEITIYNSSGDSVSSIKHPFSNKPLSRENLTERYENAMDYLGPGNVAAKMIRNTENLPDTWPAVHSMVMDDRDHIWLSTIVENDKNFEWWVLSKEGKQLGQFQWPRSKEIKVVKNNKVYVLEEDPETGVDSIVRYGFEIN